MRSFTSLVQSWSKSLSGLRHPIKSYQEEKVLSEVAGFIWQRVHKSETVTAEILEESVAEAGKIFGKKAVDTAFMAPVWRVQASKDALIQNEFLLVSFDPMHLIFASGSGRLSDWIIEQRSADLTKPVDIRGVRGLGLLEENLYGTEALGKLEKKESILEKSFPSG